MAGLNLFLQLYGELGIPIHSRELSKALAKKININITPIFPAQGDGLKTLDEALKNNIRRPDINSPAFMFWYPNSYFELLGGYPKNIGFYIFEYTKIHPFFVESINGTDIICTASKWGANILKENKVRRKIVVVPGGVDSTRFNSEGNTLDNKIFRFLHIGKIENRKGTDILLKAFNIAFEGDPDIRLTLLADNPHVKDFSVGNFIKGLGLEFPTKNIEPKAFVKDILPLYKTHHCAVFPTRAEGIGLPVVEAMACGIPVIVSNNTGVTEYANDENSILLKKLKKVPVYDPLFFPRAGEYGEWEEPTVDELVDKLRWVYANYTEAQKIGANAEKWMKENYTWEKAADRLLEII